MTDEKFIELYDQYKNLLWKISKKYSSIEDDDVESIIHVSIWKAYEKLDGRSKYKTFLCNVFKSQLRDHFVAQNALMRKGVTERLGFGTIDKKPNQAFEMPSTLNKREKSWLKYYLQGFDGVEIAKKWKTNRSYPGQVKDVVFQKLRTYYTLLSRM